MFPTPVSTTENASSTPIRVPIFLSTIFLSSKTSQLQHGTQRPSDDRKMDDKKIAATSCTKMRGHRPDAGKGVRNTHRHSSTLIPLATMSDDQCSPLRSQHRECSLTPKPRPSFCQQSFLSTNTSQLQHGAQRPYDDRKMDDKKIAATSCIEMPVHRPDAAKDVRNTHRHLSTLIPLATISDDPCSPLSVSTPRTLVAPQAASLSFIVTH